jgi:hypothetical protein
MQDFLRELPDLNRASTGKALAAKQAKRPRKTSAP